VLLDGAERLMLEEGYASVTYRRVAAKAEVTSGLVQYYFPTLDDLYIGLLRRRTERNLVKLEESLQARPERPLRTLWEYSRDETTAALMTELMALGNHRKAIRTEIAEVIERFRTVECQAVAQAWSKYRVPEEEIHPDAAMFLLLGIPKLLLMESELGVSIGHKEVLALVERLLDRYEPEEQPARKSASNAKRANRKETRRVRRSA
jgi:AcrR family transcriptional regulator